MPANLVFLGPPGSGKGTYAARAAERLGVPTISTGEILRQAIRAGTPLGKEAQGFVENGKLVPDDVMGRALGERLAQPDCAPGFILDGYPRTLPQAELLDRALERRGTRVSLAVLVEATEALVLRRLGGRRTCPSCGAVYNIHTLPSKVEGVCDRCGAKTVIRDDDRPEPIKQRLRVNAEQSAPLAALYRDRGILRTVDGSAPLEDVVARIVMLANEVHA